MLRRNGLFRGGMGCAKEEWKCMLVFRNFGA